MAKFMVIVNGHSTGKNARVQNLIVPVEAGSNGGAEHVLLDNFKYVETALAFDPVKESEAYAWAYESCEIVSKDEYQKKENWITAQAMNEHNDELNRIRDMLAEENAIESKIEQLKEDLEALRESKRQAEELLEAYDKEHRLRGGYYAIDKINELMN